MNLSKHYKKVLAIFAVVIFFCSCTKETPEGEIINRYQDVSNFSKINISDGFRVYFSEIENNTIEIKTYENIHKYVIVSQKGDLVSIKFKDKVRFTYDPLVTIYIPRKQLSEVTLNGGAKFSAPAIFPSNKLKINLSGGATFQTKLEVTALEATLTGGSNLDLSGSCDIFEINSSNGGTFEGYEFEINKLTCNLTGGCVGKCTVNQSLSVVLSNGSTLKYKGNGVVTDQNITGGSQLIKVD